MAIFPSPSGGDDTAALQAWLNAGGGELGPGAFRTSAPLTINQSLPIRGAGTSVCGILPGNHNCFNAVLAATGRVEMSGFFIQYNGSVDAGVTAIARSQQAGIGMHDTYRDLMLLGANIGISLDAVDVPVLDGLQIGAAEGIIISDSVNADIGDISITNTTVSATGSGVTIKSGGGIYICNFKFSGKGTVGINLAFDAATDTGDLLVTNSSFEGLTYGVYLSAADMANRTWYNTAISNCEFESTWGIVTPLEAPRPWLKNVSLANNIWLGVGGMYVLDGIDGLSILGGVATGGSSGTNKVYLGPQVRNGVVGAIGGTVGTASTNFGANVTTIVPW